MENRKYYHNVNTKKLKRFIFGITFMAVVLGLVVGYAAGRASAKEVCVEFSEDLKPVEKIEQPEQPEQIERVEKYKITAYCPCAKCCGKFADGITSTGAVATAGRTIAVDPEVIPYGSIVVIDGNEYVAEDCGGAIKGNRIDMFFNTHAEALEYGVQNKQVVIKGV